MADATRPTVLIVDDNPDIVAVYKEIFAPCYNVRTATTGDTALTKVDDDVDLLLIDQRLPDMTGEAVVKTIRERGFECPAALVAGTLDTVDQEADLFDAYRTKPLGSADLLELAESLL